MVRGHCEATVIWFRLTHTAAPQANDANVNCISVPNVHKIRLTPNEEIYAHRLVNEYEFHIPAVINCCVYSICVPSTPCHDTNPHPWNRRRKRLLF